MRQRNVLLSMLLILMLVALVGACKKQEPVMEPEAPVEEPTPPPHAQVICWMAPSGLIGRMSA